MEKGKHRSRPAICRRTISFEIRKVGVIGAGQMGKGIAHVCALAGYDVAINDVTPERIEAGVTDIAVQMRKSVERGIPRGKTRSGTRAHFVCPDP